MDIPDRLMAVNSLKYTVYTEDLTKKCTEAAISYIRAVQELKDFPHVVGFAKVILLNRMIADSFENELSQALRKEDIPIEAVYRIAENSIMNMEIKDLPDNVIAFLGNLNKIV